jgi:hypothetical protein
MADGNLLVKTRIFGRNDYQIRYDRDKPVIEMTIPTLQGDVILEVEPDASLNLAMDFIKASAVRILTPRKPL